MVLAPAASLSARLAPPVDEALGDLEDFLRRSGLRGWDPYDALNSPLVRGLSFGLKYPRIAFTQALKICPINLRPALGIRPSYNPKGLGLFLAGCLRRMTLHDDPRYEETARWLVGKLHELRSLGYSGACWGYPFPWQSRAFFVPRWTPTIVNTAFVAHALLDAADLLEDESCLVMARSACDFILNDLRRREEDGALCFSYTPIDDLAVHNANILGAGLLARVGARTGEEELLETARRSARYLLRHQHADGGWWYAEPEYQHWVDSFHTGFNLESLLRVIRHAEMPEARGHLELGYRYFLRRFFEADGTPRYFHDKTDPIDIHCPTQAFVTISELWEIEPAPELMSRLARWFLERMRAPTGYFYYRLGRFGPNRIPYLRWGQGWAYHGLTRLEEFLHRSADLKREER